MAASMPWLSGADYKRLCAWFPYATLLLVLTRDRGSGRVTIGRNGLPRIHYWPDRHDRDSMMNVRILIQSQQSAEHHDIVSPKAVENSVESSRPWTPCLLPPLRHRLLSCTCVAEVLEAQDANGACK